jgi:hypothetical protein
MFMMATVKQTFTFKHVEYQPGDELDLDTLDPEDKNDLLSRGYFDVPQETGDDQSKTENKKPVTRSKTK